MVCTTIAALCLLGKWSCFKDQVVSKTFNGIHHEDLFLLFQRYLEQPTHSYQCSLKDLSLAGKYFFSSSFVFCFPLGRSDTVRWLSEVEAKSKKS